MLASIAFDLVPISDYRLRLQWEHSVLLHDPELAQSISHAVDRLLLGDSDFRGSRTDGQAQSKKLAIQSFLYKWPVSIEVLERLVAIASTDECMLTRVDCVSVLQRCVIRSSNDLERSLIYRLLDRIRSSSGQPEEIIRYAAIAR